MARSPFSQTGAKMLFFMAFLGCATQPPVPYTSEECALVDDFEQACSRLNGPKTDDEGYPIKPTVQEPDVYEVIERRNALGVSKDRRWWCEDPAYANGYKHEAHFTPSTDGCGAVVPKL